jgi:UDP-glucuronate decarboxylase
VNYFWRNATFSHIVAISMRHALPLMVTGGAGFIGSHLCESLVAAGWHVLCVDNLLTGSRANLAGLLGHPRFRFLEHDVTEPFTGPLGAEVAGILNLACPASPRQYQLDPVRTTRTSVLGALNLLALARDLRVPILQASTSEVYGDPLAHPQHEGYWGNVNPIGPRACYDEGKRCAETLFFDHHRQYGVEIRVARIFNTYGPRMLRDDGRVVPSFIVSALRGEDIPVFGDGSQTRSFCFVEDMVEGLTRLFASGLAGPVNLGTQEEVTVRELAERIIALTGSRSRIRHLPLPTDDPVRRRPDTRLAREALGWQPRVTLDEGLARTIAHVEAELRATV